MTDVESVENGDIASVDYNSAVSPVRVNQTGVVLGVTYFPDDSGGTIVEGDPPHSTIYFHTGGLGDAESPIYEARFGRGVESKVYHTAGSMDALVATEELQSEGRDNRSLEWIRVSHATDPELSVNVIPSDKFRVYSDVDFER